MRSYPVKENPFGSAVSEILLYRQTNKQIDISLLYYEDNRKNYLMWIYQKNNRYFHTKELLSTDTPPPLF